MTPDDRRYSKEHEWALPQGDGQALIGITDHAQEELGDVVYLGLPEAGAQVKQFERIGEIESVKALSDLYSPLGGEVTEVNKEAIERPELVNQDPYGKGWLIRIRIASRNEMARLMTAQEYEAYLATLG